jgi:hypothetical protein
VIVHALEYALTSVSRRVHLSVKVKALWTATQAGWSYAAGKPEEPMPGAKFTCSTHKTLNTPRTATVKVEAPADTVSVAQHINYS